MIKFQLLPSQKYQKIYLVKIAGIIIQGRNLNISWEVRGDYSWFDKLDEFRSFFKKIR